MSSDLSYQGKPLASWVRALNDADRATREQAVDSLVGICTSLAAVLPALSEALKEGDAVTRARTAATLGEFGSRIMSLVPVLRSALRTAVLTADSPDVRSAASQAFRKAVHTIGDLATKRRRGRAQRSSCGQPADRLPTGTPRRLTRPSPFNAWEKPRKQKTRLGGRQNR